MKFDSCGTCMKRIRNREIDQHMCMYCDGSTYYESCIAKPVEPKKVYVTTAAQHSKYFDNQLLAYITGNVNSTMQIHEWYRHNVGFRYSMPKIKDVIFNPPATIVFWSDNTKTVVKCQEDDIYDPEKGLAMAISKKALGNKRDYYHTFKHWLKRCPHVESLYPNVTLKVEAIDFGKPFREAKDAISKLNDALLERRKRPLSEEEGR